MANAAFAAAYQTGVGSVEARNEAPLIAGIGLAALAVALAIFAFAVPRGFGLTDEALTVYLLLHPDAPMASMDHFVVGHLLALAPWNLLEVRWLTILLSLACPVALALSVGCWGRRFHALEGATGTVLSVFALLGGFLCFTAIRPLPNYAFNLVIACDLFATIYFATGARTFASSVLMGVLGGLIFLARIPVFPCTLLFLFAAAWAEGRSPLAWENLWRVTRVAVFAVIFVGVLLACGLDMSTQLRLIRALAATSHRLEEVVPRDMGYGAALLGVAAVLAGAGTLALRTADDTRRNNVVLGVSAILAAGVAIFYMLKLGFIVPSTAPGPLPSGNDALRSLAPALHVVVMALLLFYWLRGPRDSLIFRPCLLLYCLCLLPLIGTNTGIWHRTTANMAPLFLVVALVLLDAVRHGMVSRRMLAVTAAAISLPVLLALQGSMVTQPMAIAGSAFDQTIELDHPAVLAGVRVAPQLAEMQVRLERQLGAIDFDRRHEALLPGASRLGLAVLANADALGNGWYFSGYDGSESWNCAVIDLWLPRAPSRVVAIDIGSLRPVVGHCLDRYEISSQPQGLGEISTLRRR